MRRLLGALQVCTCALLARPSSPGRAVSAAIHGHGDASFLRSQIDRDLEIHRLHPVTQERMDYTTTTYGTVRSAPPRLPINPSLQASLP